MDERNDTDGFCVSGFVLACMHFVGGFYSYIARGVHPGNVVHFWYRALFPGSPVLLLLAAVFLCVGLSRSRRPGSTKSACLAVIGLIIASLSLLHLLAQLIYYRFLGGFA